MLIEVQNLRKSYRQVQAVDGVSFHVNAGEVYGLIGPDGSGKTTTMRLLCGALRPDLPGRQTSSEPTSQVAGGIHLTNTAIRIAGYDLAKQPEAARTQIGYLSQRFALYEELSVLENIRFFAEQRGLPQSEWQPRCMEILEFVGLAEFINRRAGYLSGGMRQKLGLATALVHQPQVLLLDEPTTGVDPVTRQDFWQLIIHLVGQPRADGHATAVLVSTPYMDEAARCTRIGFLHHGRLAMEGTPAQLRQHLQDRVIELLGQPLINLRLLVRSDPDIQDVQRFGDRLHIRVNPGTAQIVIERLTELLAGEDVQIQSIRLAPPQLEDVFIDMLATQAQRNSNSERNRNSSETGIPKHAAGGEIAVNRIGSTAQSSELLSRMDSPVIQIQDLTKRFGDFTAVDHISFRVHAGEVVGYLGPNGSGKTTTIRMLLGLLRPSEGEAQVLGYDVVRQAEPLRAKVGYMSQKFALYNDLTVGENLAFYAGVYGVNERSRHSEVIDRMGLHGLERHRVGELSTGWRQRLALGIAIVHRPLLLFLDEPTSGVDPLARRAFWDLIYDLVASGVTALVTTHYMDEAEYCGRVGIMRDGRLLAMDTPSALKTEALPGVAWDIFVDSTNEQRNSSDGSDGYIRTIRSEASVSTLLLPALDSLLTSPGVLRAGLVSDHLRAITPPDVDAAVLLAWLSEAGVIAARVERVEPTLEDVFLALASSN